MAVNRDKPDRWKTDVAKSVDMYNEWFLNFAPQAFRATRIETTKKVEIALQLTSNLTKIDVNTLHSHPEILSTLRMSACPPLAVDRLVGLAGVSKGLVNSIEKGNRLPSRANPQQLAMELEKICTILEKMADPDIFVWLERRDQPTELERFRAATIIADRLCGSEANPIIRNAQEQRQLSAISNWLINKGYTQTDVIVERKIDGMKAGSFSTRMNVQVSLLNNNKQVNIPVDLAVSPLNAPPNALPLLIEAKSAGDFTNVNKRRKEEAAKMKQLRDTYGDQVRFVLFLCGYFDAGYLGYEAAEGIDWVWEHRIDDLSEFGL